MSEPLNAEAILASIVELRKSLAEQGERSDKATAELRKGIAEQGKRIDKLVEEFAEARAELNENNRKLDENNRKLDENDRKFDENNRKLDENNRKFDENNRKLDENNRKLDENNRKLDENNRKLDENNYRVGKLTNKVGKIVEKIVLPGIVDKFNEKGFKFDKVSANVEILNDKKDGNVAELDALLENGKFVIAVETKTELTVKDVNAYIKRLQALHKVSRFKGKKIYGAFSTAIAEKRSISYALKNGFYVLQQPDAMAIRILDFPKGCSAKAW